MCRNWYPGAAMCLGYRTKHTFHTARDARFIGGAFENGRLHPGFGYAFLNILDEHVDHDFITAQFGPRSAKMKVHWHVVVSVDSSSRNDVEISLGGDSLDARDVASQTDDR